MDSSPWPGPLATLTALTGSTSFVRPFTGSDWGLLFALIVVLVIAGLASASETALTSVSRIKIRNMAEDGDPRAQLIEQLLRDPNTFLSTILVVNNVAVIVASTLATIIALNTFTDWGEVISTVLISLIVLIFCEIAPKTAAVQAPERWALVVVRPVHATSVALRPVTAALTFVTTGLVRLFGGKPRVKGPFVTEEELRLLVDVGQEEGVLEEEEKEMIHNVFELGDTTVREVMVPRIDMVTIEEDAPVSEAVNLIVQGGQSRIPVYSESIDNIVGVLYAKDLLRVLATGQQPATVRPLVREAYFVPETKRLDDLLHELQQQRVHMAIVVDEYGGVAGLVTIEDVVEEIIGDIQDEYDREEVLYEKLSDNEYIVDAKLSIDDLNELLDAKMPSEDYDTLGGFVYSQLDKIPSVGDTVHFDGLTFTVLGTKGRRVTKVKVVRGASEELPAPSQAGRRDAGHDAGHDEAHDEVPAPPGPAASRETAAPSGPVPPPTGVVPDSLGAPADRILHTEAAHTTSGESANDSTASTPAERAEPADGGEAGEVGDAPRTMGGESSQASSSPLAPPTASSDPDRSETTLHTPASDAPSSSIPGAPSARVPRQRLPAGRHPHGRGLQSRHR